MINQLLVQTYSPPACCTRAKLPDFYAEISAGVRVVKRKIQHVDLRVIQWRRFHPAHAGQREKSRKKFSDILRLCIFLAPLREMPLRETYASHFRVVKKRMLPDSHPHRDQLPVSTHKASHCLPFYLLAKPRA
jgi:hypothetical protein